MLSEKWTHVDLKKLCIWKRQRRVEKKQYVSMTRLRLLGKLDFLLIKGRVFFNFANALHAKFCIGHDFKSGFKNFMSALFASSIFSILDFF